MTTKTIPAFVIGLLVGVAVSYVGLQSPVGDNAAGTVAPAERYRAEQPSSDDLQLGDQELQEVLQTDEFARLIADESFQKAMANPEFRAALDNSAFHAAMSNAAVREAMASGGQVD